MDPTHREQRARLHQCESSQPVRNSQWDSSGASRTGPTDAGGQPPGAAAPSPPALQSIGRRIIYPGEQRKGRP